jgi:hypothetical protein
MSNPSKGLELMKATITTHIGNYGNTVYTVSLNGIESQTGCPRQAKRMVKHLEKVHS